MVISVYDLRQQRVPNVALFLIFVPATLALMVQGKGLLGADIWSSVVGMALGFSLTLPGYVLRLFGAGDVKFAAVLGLLLGTARSFEMMLISSLLMGVTAIVLLQILKLPRGTKFPAAPMLALAFAVEMGFGPLLTA